MLNGTGNLQLMLYLLQNMIPKLPFKKSRLAAANTSRLTIRIRCPSGEQIAPQVLEIEKGLVATVEELHKLKGIKENIPSVDELVELKEEREVGVETDKRA